VDGLITDYPGIAHDVIQDWLGSTAQ